MLKLHLNLKRPLFILLLISTIIFVAGIFLFNLNLFGLQDRYYGSKYFRPYAQLKQEPNRNQVILLKDNKVLLTGAFASEIFDPKTKTSEMIPGSRSINAYWDYSNFLLLTNGDVLITQGGWIDSHGGGVACSVDSCQKDYTPLFDSQKKVFRWIRFPLRYLEGHTASALPEGKVLLIGGVLGQHRRGGYGLLQGRPYFKNDIVVFDPKTSSVKILGHLKIPRYNHKTILLDDQKALVFGGIETSGEYGNDIDNYRGLYTKAVELVDLKTGTSRVIGSLRYGTRRLTNIFSLGNGKFLLPQIVEGHGRVHSEIFDLNHPQTTKEFTGPMPTWYWDGIGNCAPIPKNRFICVSSKGVRDIDPVHMVNRNIDQVATRPLFDAMPIYVPKIGLLLFASSRDIFHKEKAVQIFNYDRYFKDFK